MRVLLFTLCLLIGMPAFGQSAETGERNEFWVIWERNLRPFADCEGTDCGNTYYFGHYIDGMDSGQAQQFFSGLGSFAASPSNANIRLPHSPICLGGDTGEELPDPTLLEVATALETLRGLAGVHVDLRGVRGPQAFRGSFGERAQEFTVSVLADHGIPLLNKEQAAATPGNATLKMRFSPEVHGCRPWSVSLSLTQRLLLARKPDVMIESTTWSSSARQDESNVDFLAENAMEQVIIAFAQAWSEANDPSWVKPESTN